MSKRKKYSLVGVNGNAFAVMGYVTRCMRECKCLHEEIDKYRDDAMSGDYNNLLCISMNMINKLNSRDYGYR